MNKKIQFHPKPKSRPMTVRQALSKLKKNNKDNLPSFTDKYARMWPRLLPGQSARWIVKQGATATESCVKIHPDRPSKTLPKFQTGRGFATIAHWNEPRALTISEAQCLASFPEDFIFRGTYMEQWGQIGNCVPPKLILHISEHLKKILNSVKD